LERQAEAARRHGDLVAELSALKLFLAGREIAALRTRLEAAAGERARLGDSEKALRSVLAQLDTAVMAAEAELTARGDADLSSEFVRVEQLRERARGIAAVIAERRRSLERDRGQLMDGGVIASLEADAARLREDLDSVAGELAALEPEAVALSAQEDELADERAASLDAASEGTHTAVPANAAARAAAEVRGELRSMQNARTRAESDARALESRLTVLRERAERLDEEATRLRDVCEQSQEVEVRSSRSSKAAEARRIAAEAAADNALGARQDAAEELSRWTARAEALSMALEAARAKAAQSTSRASTARSARCST
jgi:chromosome segregation protein